MKTLRELKKERNKLGFELYTDLSLSQQFGPLIIYNLIIFSIIIIASHIISWFGYFEYQRVFSSVSILFLTYEFFTLHNIQVTLGLISVRGLNELFQHDYYYMMKFDHKLYGIQDIAPNQKLVLHELNFDVDCSFDFQEKEIYETTEIFSKQREQYVKENNL